MKKVYVILLLLSLNISILPSLTGFIETPEFTINEQTLPVTLSTFMAVPNINDNCIAINWITQSESNLIGYHIHRSETNMLTTATKVTSTIIPATNGELTNDYSFQDNEVEEEITYYYWLQSIDFDTSEFFGPVIAKIDKPEDDNGIQEIVLGNDLYSNYPNPFNPSTTLSYSLSEPQDVIIDVFNIKGQKIKRLFSGYVHEVNTKINVVWNGDDSTGENVTSGIYFAKIKTASFTKTAKMLLTK